MRLWTLTLVAGALSVLLAPLFAGAQQPERVAYLGYMSPGDIPRYDSAFLLGLQHQGYILPGEIPRHDKAFWRDLSKQGSFGGK